MVRLLLFALLLLLPSLVGAQTISQPLRVLDESALQGAVTGVNCSGAGITCTVSGSTGTLTVSGGGSSDTVLRLTGDVSTGANTTLVDVTGMSFTADAAGVYAIEITGMVSAALATTGYGIGINCAQTPVTVALGGRSQLANSGTVTAWSAITNNAIVGVTSGIPTNATNVPVHGGGILVAHATVAGTCTFRFRSEVAAVTTLKANTTFIVRKLN